MNVYVYKCNIYVFAINVRGGKTHASPGTFLHVGLLSNSLEEFPHEGSREPSSSDCQWIVHISGIMSDILFFYLIHESFQAMFHCNNAQFHEATFYLIPQSSSILLWGKFIYVLFLYSFAHYFPLWVPPIALFYQRFSSFLFKAIKEESLRLLIIAVVLGYHLRLIVVHFSTYRFPSFRSYLCYSLGIDWRCGKPTRNI